MNRRLFINSLFGFGALIGLRKVLPTTPVTGAGSLESPSVNTPALTYDAFLKRGEYTFGPVDNSLRLYVDGQLIENHHCEMCVSDFEYVVQLSRLRHLR